LAQGNQAELFDQKKADQEMEIMKGILGTTLEFAFTDLYPRQDDSRTPVTARYWNTSGFSNIVSVYLYGQGAIFVIPTSKLASLGGMAGPLAGLQTALGGRQEYLFAVQENLARVRDQLNSVTRGGPTRITPPIPPQPPQPQQPPKPPVPSQPSTNANQEAAKRTLAEAQENLNKLREEAELRHQKLMGDLTQIKVHLIEALANYGDSLTFLKPGEYINVVLSIDGEPLLSGESTADRQQIMSVQKSVISEYKAGKISLGAFKQKVLQYTN